MSSILKRRKPDPTAQSRCLFQTDNEIKEETYEHADEDETLDSSVENNVSEVGGIFLVSYHSSIN